jgi:hypothetical protein
MMALSTASFEVTAKMQFRQVCISQCAEASGCISRKRGAAGLKGLLCVKGSGGAGPGGGRTVPRVTYHANLLCLLRLILLSFPNVLQIIPCKQDLTKDDLNLASVHLPA